MNNVLPTYPRTNLNFTHGEGSYLYEVNGDQYLDSALALLSTH